MMRMVKKGKSRAGMRYVLLWLVICMLMVLVPSSVDASGYKTGYVSPQTPIKMYRRANVKSKIVRQLAHNKQVQYKPYKKGWYFVKRGNKSGYVRAKYISRSKTAKESTPVYSASYFMQMGVLYWGGWRWTWYSQRVLPGGGLSIPGRHVNYAGYVSDGNGYICLASSALSRGTVVNTPFGWQGKVYDSGCSYDTLDVYVSW